MTPRGIKAVERYTLEEAQIKLRERECMLEGHEFDVHLIVGKSGPHVVICRRCGKTWRVADDAEEPS